MSNPGLLGPIVYASWIFERVYLWHSSQGAAGTSVRTLQGAPLTPLRTGRILLPGRKESHLMGLERVLKAVLPS